MTNTTYNRWKQADEQERANILYTRWLDLKRVREPFLSKWRQVSRYISVFSGKFDEHEHDQVRDDRYILDSDTGNFLDLLASGLMSGASSPARAWFKVQPNDPALADNYDVINYCDEVTKLLLRIFSSSNTYNTLHTIYRELALFGISADIVYEDFNRGIKHHLLTAGEFCVDTNADGDIDTLYRSFELTTIQAVKAFGYDILPTEIKNAYDRSELSTYWQFIHAIEPRVDRDVTALDSKNKAWASYYVSLNGKAKIIRESGFDYFPCIVPRWDVLGGNNYGVSPCMNALPNVKQLQQETLRKAELINYYTKPPLQAPNSARQNPISLATGAINYTQNTSNDLAIKPIVQSIGDLNALSQDIQQIKQSIRSQLYVDLFQMVGSTAGDRRTTVEIYALQQEQMLALGPVVERNQNECLGRLVDITYRRLLDAGKLPPLPDVLQGQELKIEFTSVLAQSQKAVDINSVDRFFSALASAGQILPEIYDRLDPDGYVDEYRDRLGVAPKILRSKEDAEKIRQQRAEQQQQMQQQQDQMANAQIQQQQNLAQKSGVDTSLAMQQLDDVGGGNML